MGRFDCSECGIDDIKLVIKCSHVKSRNDALKYGTCLLTTLNKKTVSKII